MFFFMSKHFLIFTNFCVTNSENIRLIDFFPRLRNEGNFFTTFMYLTSDWTVFFICASFLSQNIFKWGPLYFLLFVIVNFYFKFAVRFLCKAWVFPALNQLILVTLCKQVKAYIKKQTCPAFIFDFIKRKQLLSTLRSPSREGALKRHRSAETEFYRW